MFTSRRARLGVVVSPAAPTDSIGALIQSVTPGGPAEKAGIRSGDIILRINGQSLVEGNIRVSRGESVPGLALSLIAAGINAGDSVVVQYQRGKDRKTTTLIAGDEPVWGGYKGGENLPFGGEWPGDELRQLDDGPEVRMRMDGPQATYSLRTPMPRVFMLGSPLAELELAPLNPELGRYFSANEGVLVISVPPESKLGLKPGDVVLSVDSRKVKVPSQLFRVLQSYEPGEEFKLEVMRMKKALTVTGSVAER
jgi:S1-C subfamily serine protease